MDYKKISIILTFLIIIFAGLSGFFYYQTYINYNKTNFQNNLKEKIILKQQISNLKIEEIKNALTEANLSNFEINTIETNDISKPIGWYGIANNKIAGYSSYIDYDQNKINIYLYFEDKENQKIEDLVIYGNMAYINALMNAIEYKKEPGTNYKKAYENSILIINQYIAKTEQLPLQVQHLK